MNQFEVLGVSHDTCQRMADAGMTEPTGIQALCLSGLPKGNDACIASQTGTGKTLAYLLPLLMRISPELTTERQTEADRTAAPLGMVLVPSAELGLQVRDVLKMLAPELHTVALVGGANPRRQIEAMKKGADVVIGSLGRVLDLVRQGRLKGTHIRCLVIDEADQLLDDGNRAECETLLKALSPSRQTVLCSATFVPALTEWANLNLKNPISLRADDSEQPPLPATLRHLAILTDSRKKLDLMRRILRNEAHDGAIAFHNRAADLDFLAQKLKHHQVRVGILHGGISKLSRQSTMRAFRSGAIDLLLATELAARGLDLSRVSLVFNLDFPSSPAQYVNRVGRTARMGRSGTAITLYDGHERFLLEKLERSLGIQFEHPIYREGVIREANEADHRIEAAKARHAKKDSDTAASKEGSATPPKAKKSKKRPPTKRAIAKGKEKKARKRVASAKRPDTRRAAATQAGEPDASGLTT